MSSPMAVHRVGAMVLALAALVGLSGRECGASKQIDPEGMPFKSTPQRAWDAMDRTPPSLSSVIERFDVANETVPSAVVRLANQQGVLCGLYVVPWTEVGTEIPEPFASVSVTFQGATVAQILDELVALDPRFTWGEDRGVINVALASTGGDPTHPLNVRLPVFDADEVPYYLALFGRDKWRERLVPGPLFEEVYLVTGLPVGFAYSGPSLDLYPIVTISAEGWTTIEILNEVARQLKLPWYIVDRRMFGGRDIGFSMGVDLLRLPTGQPISPPDDMAARTGEETPCPCPSAARVEVASAPGREINESELRATDMVPLRERLAADGFGLVWKPTRQEAIAQRGSTRLTVTANSRRACLDNVPLNLPQESVVIEGRLHVPALLVDLTLSAARRVASAPDAGSS